MNRHRAGLRHVDRLVHVSVVASEKQWMSGTTRLAAPEAQRGHIVIRKTLILEISHSLVYLWYNRRPCDIIGYNQGTGSFVS